MGWINLLVHKCDVCGRVYEEIPQECLCNSITLAINETYGSFILKDSFPDGHYITQCLVCGKMKSMSLKEILNKKHCGCVPTCISVLYVDTSIIKYRCFRCKKDHIRKAPVINFCCEDSDENSLSQRRM